METRPRTPQETISSFPDSGTMETLLLWMAPWAEVASAAQRKTAYHAPSLALTGSRPPLGDYFCGWLEGQRSQAQRSVRPLTTPPRSPLRAPVPRRGITLLLEFRHPLTQKFTMVTLMPSTNARVYHSVVAGDSLPAIRKAPGAVKG